MLDAYFEFGAQVNEKLADPEPSQGSPLHEATVRFMDLWRGFDCWRLLVPC